VTVDLVVGNDSAVAVAWTIGGVHTQPFFEYLPSGGPSVSAGSPCIGSRMAAASNGSFGGNRIANVYKHTFSAGGEYGVDLSSDYRDPSGGLSAPRPDLLRYPEREGQRGS
jgi:hypothetical protein